MKTVEEIVVMIHAQFRDIRELDKALWEQYDSSGDQKFLTALNHSNDARTKLSGLLEVISYR